ncbi:Krueppel-like factor 14 [Gracilariopsis chorda]|uniref:Krueppel-like factor 14 n=1 Tax=Gracilariopsis chorda TaxID=448386 RepID=A0A2V3J5Q5_9FLOR|nr:Krueppel-like factor 14 [Gracilariopsis chorda]|eukprot:PXF49751.1 Krueppel-like factor 14 [Gracilariopsis chorda]
MQLGSFSGDNDSNDFSPVLHFQAGVNGQANCSTSLDNPNNCCVANGELEAGIEGFLPKFHVNDAFSVGYEDALRNGLSGATQPEQCVSNHGSENLPSLDGDFQNHIDFGTNAAPLDWTAATNADVATRQEEPVIASASNELPADLVFTAADLIDDVRMGSGVVQQNRDAGPNAFHEHPLFINPELLSLPGERMAVDIQPAKNNLASAAVTTPNMANASELSQKDGMDIDRMDEEQAVIGTFTAHPANGLNAQNANLSPDIPVTVQGSDTAAVAQCEEGINALRVQELHGMPNGNGGQRVAFGGGVLADGQESGEAEVGARAPQPGLDEYNHIVATMKGLNLPSTATAEAPWLLNAGDGVTMINPQLIGEDLPSTSQAQSVPNADGLPQLFETQYHGNVVLPQMPAHFSTANAEYAARQTLPQEIFFAAPGMSSYPLPPIGGAMDIGTDTPAASLAQADRVHDHVMKEASPSNSTSQRTKKGKCKGASRQSKGRNSPKQPSKGGGIQTANPPISKKRKRTRTRVEDMDPADVHVCTFHGCGRKFAKKYNLTVHERGHRGELPYKCEVLNCGKPFMWLSSFSRHLRVHEKKRKVGSRRSQRKAVADSRSGSDGDTGSPTNVNQSIANGPSEEAFELLKMQALVNTIGINDAVVGLTHRVQVSIGKDLNIKAQLEERWKSFGYRKQKLTNSRNLPFDIRNVRLRQLCTQTL